MDTSFGLNSKDPFECRKIFCAYHSTEFLTNFCIEKDCLMPLCPSCVAEHTEEHYQCHQKPTYVNLQEALNTTKQICYDHVVTLETHRRKNLELENYILGLPEYLHKQLEECKQNLMIHISEQFLDYEKQLLSTIQEKYANDGVYDHQESEQIKECIDNQIEILYEKVAQLKSEQCLAALIRYYESDKETYSHDLSLITNYIEKNSNAGGIYISLNEDSVQTYLEGLCNKIISVEYVHEEELQEKHEMYIGCYDRPVKSGSMISMLANRRQKDVLRDRNTSKVSLTKDKRGLAVTDRTGSGVKERDSLTNSKERGTGIIGYSNLTGSRGYSQTKMKEPDNGYYYTPF